MTAPGSGSRPWLRRATVVVGTVLTLGSIPAGTTSAQTAGGESFVGYEAAASGTPLSAFPTVPALLPVDVPIEATIGLATATISSGGQGFGRASTFYPGTLTAGLRPLIETAAGVRLPIPDYPIVVEAREFEEAKGSEVPGVTMTADADPGRAVAVADAGALGIPAVFSVRSMHTESRAVLEGTAISAVSTTSLQGVDLAGALTIGSIVSEAKVTSDGTTSTCSGHVTISGAAVAGTPVVIDDEGIHVDTDAVVPGLGLGALVERTLSGLGLDVRALGGVDACGASSFGSRTTSGLLVRLPLPALGAIPAGGGLSMVLGSTSATAGGSTLPADDPVPADAPPVFGDVVTRGPGPFSGGAVLPPVDTGTGVSAPTGTTGFPTDEVAYDFHGLPLSLVAGLALLVVVASSRLRRYMEHIIGMVGP